MVYQVVILIRLLASPSPEASVLNVIANFALAGGMFYAYCKNRNKWLLFTGMSALAGNAVLLTMVDFLTKFYNW